MAEKQSFNALLEKVADSNATFIAIGFDVEEVFGKWRVPVVV